MSQSNKATRDKAIPFESEAANGLAVTLETYGDGHFSQPEYIPGALTKVAPFTRPEKADIVEAYLFIEMTAPSNKALEVKVGIGQWIESGGEPTVVPVEVYSQEYINAQHRRISGSDDPYTVAANGTLIIEANLLPALPRRGDPNFLSDLFPLLLTFNSGISTANGYSLNKFKLTCSGQIGLGR